MAYRRSVLSVLFVCAGNICRSPFAERYAATVAQRAGSSLAFASAGFEALDGYPMDLTMAAELSARGGSSAGFRARSLDGLMLEDAGLVLTMTLRQRHLIRSGFPHFQDKVHTLGLAGRVAPAIGPVLGSDQLASVLVERLDKLTTTDDVTDPYRLGQVVAAEVATRIAAHVDAVLADLL